MNTSTASVANTLHTDEFGRRVATRLSQATAELPHDVLQRLRVSRQQALAKRREVLRIQPALALAGHPGLQDSDVGLGFWGRVAAALPMLALAAGLVTIHHIQNERRAVEVAEVDAALLTDDLPPAAYTDPGFVQFLKRTTE